MMKSLKHTSILPYKITDRHLTYAKSYLVKNSANRVTVALLHEHLNSINELPKLSKSGVYYLLKKVLKFSHKKAHKIPK